MGPLEFGDHSRQSQEKIQNCECKQSDFTSGFEKKKKTVVSLATFVALQVWYGIPNERVPKSPLNSG